MIKKPSEVEKMINTLEDEEVGIESKVTHHGYRDASRRNRIEEEVDSLQEAKRHDKSLAVSFNGESVRQD